MQIVHCSPFRNETGQLLRGARKEAAQSLGPDWKSILDGEDQAAKTLANALDDSYVLIRNLGLPGLDHDADLILVGATGLWAIEVTNLGGLHKAEGAHWLAFNPGAVAFEPVEPNLVERARQSGSAIYTYLHRQNMPVPWVNPLLLCINPKMDVRVEDTPVAVLNRADIPGFIANSAKAFEQILNVDDVKTVSESLLTLSQTPTAKVRRPKRLPTLGMTRPELMVIGLLALMNVCLLGGFALLIWRNTLTGP